MLVCFWRVFLSFVFLLKKNVARSLASCLSDVDSGSRFCLLWPLTSVVSFYTFLWSMVFTFITLCIKSCFLYLNIVTNLFHSLFYAFQCWSSLYLIYFLSLFFMIILCFCFKSSSYQGSDNWENCTSHNNCFCCGWCNFLNCLKHLIFQLVGICIQCCAFQNW